MAISQLIILYFLFNGIYSHNKYSKEANTPKVDDLDFRPHYLQHLDKPFRMSKLNLLWSKAVVVSDYYSETLIATFSYIFRDYLNLN